MFDLDIFTGGPLKALGGRRLGGLAVVFSSSAAPDLQDEFFTRRTDFWGAASAPVLWEHGRDKLLGIRRLTTATLKAVPRGLWAELELAGRDPYAQKMIGWAKAGKLHFSTGSVPHLYRRKAVGRAFEVTSWPIAEVSLTLTPVDPLARVWPIDDLTLIDDAADDLIIDDRTADERIDDINVRARLVLAELEAPL